MGKKLACGTEGFSTTDLDFEASLMGSLAFGILAGQKNSSEPSCSHRH